MLSGKVVPSFRKDGQKGLFTIADVQKNEILITYDGPIIDHATRYSIQIAENKHIEGTEEPNAFPNHSCAPNAYVDWNGVSLRALRDLKAGEEITCNYLTADYDLYDKFVCACSSASCYGEIKGFKYLTPQQQLKLEPFLPPFMKKRVAHLSS